MGLSLPADMDIAAGSLHSDVRGVFQTEVKRRNPHVPRCLVEQNKGGAVPVAVERQRDCGTKFSSHNECGLLK